MFHPYDFEKLEIDGTTISSNSCKVFSKNELYCISNLLNTIINGKREVAVPGTPRNYIKIYTECWQHNSNQRPTILRIFNELEKISYKNIISDERIFEKYDENENNDQLITGIESSNSTKSLNYYTNLHDETTKELMLISSIIKTLNENIIVNDQNNFLNLTNSFLFNSSKQDKIDEKQKILYDLNQLFITQFNIQSVVKYAENSIIFCIKKYFVENNKNPKDILDQYNSYKYRYYFTSIIGFFYEYGIGTIIDYYKAFEMYTQASKNFNSLNKLDNLLKENQIIGSSYDGKLRLVTCRNLLDGKLPL
ncbi:6078_t:CDS:2, partial [Gigaspora margarita]